MRQEDAQLFLAWFNLRPPRTGVRDVVEVVDGEATGDGFLVLATAVLKGGVHREDRQTTLQLAFLGFKLARGELATTASFQGIFYLCTGSCYECRIECLVEEVGSTYPNLALYVFSYSKHVFEL